MSSIQHHLDAVGICSLVCPAIALHPFWTRGRAVAGGAIGARVTAEVRPPDVGRGEVAARLGVGVVVAADPVGGGDVEAAAEKARHAWHGGKAIALRRLGSSRKGG